MPRKLRDLASRIWPHVDIGSGAACWIWRSHAYRDGYAMLAVKVDGEWTTRRVHRLVWEMTNGDPGDLLVLHYCDRPLCVRPDHLFLGTAADNAADKTNKGREARGSAMPQAVLDEVTVRRMRREYARHPRQHSKIAAELGVSRSTVSYALAGKTWNKPIRYEAGP